ncbi:MAG: hypothetical protein ACRCZP_08905 [Phycicoccus sp.]
MSGRRIVRITIPESATNARVSFAYDPAVVELVKTYHGSRWNPTDKVWTVPLRHIPSLAADLEGWGWDVIHTRPGRAAAPPPSAAAPVNWAAELFAAVGPQRADTVYRALSRILHPDTGGDTRLMQQLNAARPEQRQDGTR